LWTDIQRNVSHYKRLVQSEGAPTEVKCWNDFVNIPILTRSLLQDDVNKYIDHTKKIIGWSTTGGSTGTPFRIPYGLSESKLLRLNAWLGRGFYDVQVSDRLFHLWGHAHLFGKGGKRYINKAKRNVKNYLLGYKVFSAYHLTPERLREAGEAIIKMRPDYIIGYSRSLAMLAKENVDQTFNFHKLSIKAIIATTEAFSQTSDAELIEHVFGCAVGMEYGAAETGVIAYTHPSNNRFRVFWDTYLIESIPIDQKKSKLLLTSLYPRAMPLIRYEIGDTVCNYDLVGNSIISFDKVLGRDNDLIHIGNKSFIHPVAIIHSIQSHFGVLGAQIIQEKDNSISIKILCKEPLHLDVEEIIRKDLSTLDPQLKVCRIIYVTHLEQTPAGKTKWVIKR
jgi:phenylacetate-CoA ligase